MSSETYGNVKDMHKRLQNIRCNKDRQRLLSELLAEFRADVEVAINRSVAEAKYEVTNYHDLRQICRKNGMRLLREGTLPWGPDGTSPPDGFDFEILDDMLG
ncbi:unnamed protein product [Mucor circinelloides]